MIKYFKSNVFSRDTKRNLYLTILRPTSACDCQVWPMPGPTDCKVRSFKDKVLKKYVAQGLTIRMDGKESKPLKQRKLPNYLTKRVT